MRRFLLPVVGLAMLVTAAPAVAQAPAAPIKIGVLAPITGVFASFAKDIIDGAQLYYAEGGGQLGGRKLELVVEDYQVRPDVAVTKITKLAEQDRVHAVVGIVLSSAAVAVKDYVNTRRSARDLRLRGGRESHLSPTHVFITYTGNMTGGPSATGRTGTSRRDERDRRLGQRGTVEIIWPGRAFGRPAAGRQEIYAPLGPRTSRRTSPLRRDVDVIGVQTVGADGVRFVKQWREYGMRADRWSTPRSVQRPLAPSASGDAAVSAGSQPYQYTSTPTQQKFVEAFRAK
jgi:branched-chain amino acid transport system substrate-binding protein